MSDSQARVEVTDAVRMYNGAGELISSSDPSDTLFASGTGDPRDVNRYANPPLYEQVCRTLKMRPLPEIHHYLDLSTGIMYHWDQGTQVWTIVVGDPPQ